jgi:HAD superfamily hydrolase (TIGR01509 family)
VSAAGRATPAKAVLWDIDGTLALSEPFHLRVLQATAREDYGIELPDVFHEEMVGRTAEEAFILVCERYGLEEDFGRWIERKYRRYVEVAPEIPSRPGAVEAFRRLRGAGIQQALVSNSDRIVVEANIRSLGLLVPRLVTVTVNDVRLGKPHPEPYLRAAHLLGVEPAACVVVEDSPTGARAGVAAGMRVLAWPENPAFVFPEAAQLVPHEGDIGAALAGLGLPAA